MAWWWPFGRGNNRRSGEAVAPAEPVAASQVAVADNEPRGLPASSGADAASAPVFRSTVGMRRAVDTSGPRLRRDAGRFGNGASYQSFAMRLIARRQPADEAPARGFARNLPSLLSYERPVAPVAPVPGSDDPSGVVSRKSDIESAIAAAESSSGASQPRRVPGSDFDRLRAIAAMHESQGTSQVARTPRESSADAPDPRRFAPASPSEVPRSMPARRARVTEGIKLGAPPPAVDPAAAPAIDRTAEPPDSRADATTPQPQAGAGDSATEQPGNQAPETPASPASEAVQRAIAATEQPSPPAASAPEARPHAREGEPQGSPSGDVQRDMTPSGDTTGSAPQQPADAPPAPARETDDDPVQRAIAAAERPASDAGALSTDDDDGGGGNVRAEPPGQGPRPPAQPPAMARTVDREVTDEQGTAPERVQPVQSPEADTLEGSDGPEMVLRRTPETASPVAGQAETAVGEGPVAAPEPGQSAGPTPSPAGPAEAQALPSDGAPEVARSSDGPSSPSQTGAGSASAKPGVSAPPARAEDSDAPVQRAVVRPVERKIEAAREIPSLAVLRSPALPVTPRTPEAGSGSTGAGRSSQAEGRPPVVSRSPLPAEPGRASPAIARSAERSLDSGSRAPAPGEGAPPSHEASGAGPSEAGQAGAPAPGPEVLRTLGTPEDPISQASASEPEAPPLVAPIQREADEDVVELTLTGRVSNAVFSEGAATDAVEASETTPEGRDTQVASASSERAASGQPTSIARAIDPAAPARPFAMASPAAVSPMVSRAGNAEQPSTPASSPALVRPIMRRAETLTAPERTVQRVAGLPRGRDSGGQTRAGHTPAAFRSAPPAAASRPVVQLPGSANGTSLIERQAAGVEHGPGQSGNVTVETASPFVARAAAPIGEVDDGPGAPGAVVPSVAPVLRREPGTASRHEVPAHAAAAGGVAFRQVSRMAERRPALPLAGAASMGSSPAVDAKRWEGPGEATTAIQRAEANDMGRQSAAPEMVHRQFAPLPVVQRALVEGGRAANVEAVSNRESSQPEQPAATFNIDEHIPKIADALWKEFRRRLRSERERARGRI